MPGSNYHSLSGEAVLHFLVCQITRQSQKWHQIQDLTTIGRLAVHFTLLHSDCLVFWLLLAAPR